MSNEYSQQFKATELQYLYDAFVKYNDPCEPELKTCVVCLSIANPYENLLRMECCTETALHYSCWFDVPRGRSRTIKLVNEDIESRRRIQLNKPCPTCQEPNSVAVIAEGYLNTVATINVLCKICDGTFTLIDWILHWKKCGAAFIRIKSVTDIEAGISTSPSPFSLHFWKGFRPQQTALTCIFVTFLIACFILLIFEVAFGKT